MKIEDLFNEYEEHLRFYRKKGTLQAYKKDFKLLKRAFDDLLIYDTEHFTINTYDQVIRWIKNNTNKKNSKTNDTMSSLITALKYHNIDYSFKITKLIDDTTPFRVINDKEVKIIIEYLGELDLDESNNLLWVTTLLLAFDTGARKNELINIKTEDVDLNDKVIYLQTTKTHKRVVKFGNLSYKFIKLIYDKQNEYLLYNRLRNQPLTKKSIEYFISNLNKTLKIDSGNITLHRIRKTFATKLYLKGMPLPTIQKILGHADIKMTMKYIDVSSLTLAKHYKEFYPY